MSVIFSIGARDGIGNTSTLLAISRAARDKKCVLIIYADVNYPHDISDHLGGVRLKLTEDLAEKDFSLPASVLRSWCRIGDNGIYALRVSNKLSYRFLNLMRTIFDVVLIDAGSRLNEFSSKYILISDKFIVHTNSQLSSTRSANALCVQLLKQKISSEQISLVLHTENLSSMIYLPVGLNNMVNSVYRLQTGDNKHVEQSSIIDDLVISDSAVCFKNDLSGNEVLTLREDLRLGMVKDLEYDPITDGLSKNEIEEEVRARLDRFIAKQNLSIRSICSEEIIAQVMNDLLRLGAIEPLMADPEITEIMVNGCRPIHYEKNGLIIESKYKFSTIAHVYEIISRMVSSTGRRVDESSPLLDARLPDGSRVHVALPPLAIDGPCITIRRFAGTTWTLERMVEFGTLAQKDLEILKQGVINRKNIMIIGGTGSGKTTLLNALSAWIDSQERIITIEDSAELRLQKPHVVRLEARPANMEGEGKVDIRELVRNALRMRPDRIIIGECRGAESFDMLQAMNTGHAGSMTTLHANSSNDAIRRLATLVCLAGFNLPYDMVRGLICSAIDIIVQVKRCPNGKRKVCSIINMNEMQASHD